MPALEIMHQPVEPVLFRNLRKYTASEAASINAYSRLFEAASSWKVWVEDILRELLEAPTGRTLEILQSHQLHGEQTHKYTFDRKEIFIGRAPDNDISLPLRSISRKHARIVERESDFYIEDLESSSGTYVNRQSLEPGQTRRLTTGDEVLIFPYVLRVNMHELWARDSEVELSYSTRLTPSATSEFVSRLGSDLCLFQFRIHPDMGHAVVALARPFLTTILSRLTQSAISELAASDSGLFEFVVVSILERANRELRFPFQFLLVPGDRFALRDEAGIALEASIRLAHAHGSILLFLPESCLDRLQTATSSGLPSQVREPLVWRVAVRAGSVDLVAGDLEDMGTGDTLLYTPEVELVLPCGDGIHASERGWRAVRDENNPHCFEVKEFFERSAHMEDNAALRDETETGGKVELSALPVRIHVVLHQVELTLKDLEGLTNGSIIQLEQEHPQPVQLVVNGTVLGAGELVEIDNQLGVQITRWRKA
jgi:type III secretion system YscQ/HrcQ family protein